MNDEKNRGFLVGNFTMISPKILEKPWDLRMNIAPKISTKHGELNYHCVGFKAKKGRKTMVFTVKSRIV